MVGKERKGVEKELGGCGIGDGRTDCAGEAAAVKTVGWWFKWWIF
jgi:hypothetical protein